MAAQVTNDSQIDVSFFSKQLQFLSSPTFNCLQPPPFSNSIIVIDDDNDNEEPNKKPVLGFEDDDTNLFDVLGSLNFPPTFNYLPSLPLSTLEPTRKKRSRLGFQFDDVYPFRFLDSPTTTNSLRSPPLTTDSIIIIDDDDDDVTLEPPKNKKPRLGFQSGVVHPLDELSNVFKGEHETTKEKDNNGVVSKEDSWLSDVNKEKKNEKNVPERKGNEHMTLDDLGVTVEDLKNIPWEAFDPTWEIRSDPWLCNYI